MLWEAIVRLAPAIDLPQHLLWYRQQKRPAVETVTAQVKTSVRALLSELSEVSTAVTA